MPKSIRTGTGRLLLACAATGALIAAGCGGGAAGGSGSAAGNGSGGTGGGSVTPVGPSGCPLFTTDDLWNLDVSGMPADAAWTSKIQALVGSSTKIHPDFGAGFGIPFNVVPASQPVVPIVFDQYPDESDPGPYPFPGPNDTRIEGGEPTNCSGDCHVLVVEQGTCELFEGYACQYTSGWHCGNGAKWDLTKNSYGQRPEGWTSADAAGLPIYAGLGRYEEVTAGEITHAMRFTLRQSAGNHIPPATHDASSGSDPNRPPMGLRVRLQASFDISGYNATAQIFLRAWKKYGLILADNGSNFYVTGEDNPNWNDDDLNALKNVPASAFEVVSP